MKVSAGTLLYRTVNGEMQVLLVHPSGNYNKQAKWGIPKGLPDAEESLEQAARRETEEEIGVIAGHLDELGYVDYTKSKKRVHCFCGPAPGGTSPRCASWEIDKAEFVALDTAKELIHRDQREFITRLESLLKSKSES